MLDFLLYWMGGYVERRKGVCDSCKMQVKND
jgi:hypothetical protein